MVRIHIPAELRLAVTDRAHGKCEYCLIHQDDVPFSHQIDHILPLKHQGATESDNLALACLECNRYKGSDIATIDPDTHEITPLFNPRRHRWAEHFSHHGVQIVGLTPVGRATIILLRLNDPIRLTQRQALITVGRYPL